MSENGPGKVFAALHAIGAEVGVIGKDRKNTFQGFAFRGVEQVLTALQPLLTKHKVVLQPSYTNLQMHEQEKGFGASCQLALTFWHIEDGSALTFHSVGFASDSSDKASNKAMTAALKYALVHGFCIRESESSDGDADTPEVKIKRAKGGATMRDILG